MSEPARAALLDLRRGDVVWAALDPAVGREQSGRRPAVIVADESYLARAVQLAIVVPVTTRDRQWPNHVELHGRGLELGVPSFAMTEQIKTIDRRRIDRRVGSVDTATLRAIDGWLRDFLGFRS